jgi:hypothetical protein
VALQEACKRLKERGLYVVADVAHLPFKAEAFEGLVSLHTLHHLPLPEQKLAYFELDRVLAKSCSGVVVNGWTESSLMNASLPLVKAFEALGRFVARLRGKQSAGTERKSKEAAATPTGTFVEKLTPSWLKKELGGKINYQIFVWRSVSVRFMRALVHRQTGGKYWLRLLYRLEERFPKFFGTNGQYPIVVIYKP